MTTTATPSSQDSHAEDETGVTDAFVDFSDEGDEEDMGLLDFLASFHEEARAMNQTVERISKNMTRIGDEIKARAAETTALQSQYEEVKHVGR